MRGENYFFSEFSFLTRFSVYLIFPIRKFISSEDSVSDISRSGDLYQKLSLWSNYMILEKQCLLHTNLNNLFFHFSLLLSSSFVRALKKRHSSRFVS